MGFIVAVMSREHASVGFIIVGVVVGISGAVSYLLLPWCPPFRRLSALGRLVTSAVTAALPTVAFGAYAAFSKSAPLDVASLLNFTSIAMGFASISAMLVARVESWWGA
jgi:hypothetical protein